MFQRLRILTTPTEDWSLVPSTRVSKSQILATTFQCPLLVSRSDYTHIHTPWPNQVINIKINLKKIKVPDKVSSHSSSEKTLFEAAVIDS